MTPAFRPARTFRFSRSARERYDIREPLAGTAGHIVATDRAGMRELAARMNSERSPGVPTVQAGDLVALALMHEIFHLVVERYQSDVRAEAMALAIQDLRTALGPRADTVFAEFAQQFPAWAGGPEPPHEILEELLLTRIANENPAAGPARELFDDRPVATASSYQTAVARVESHFASAPAFGPEGQSLVELLRAPARNAPTSLLGQLRYIREHWMPLLGDLLARLLDEIDLAIGVLAEEELAMHRRFGGAQGGFGGLVEVPSFAGLDAEAERFSSDSAWMPKLVLMAKSTYVWLDQLSRAYQRDIHTLDAIPDEELDRLAAWGVTGLWLIGLWERSRASERIKQMRGNVEAVASAYSLDDYLIAEDLGGEAAYQDLRGRAWARGIRLASDMVPNHMGIDSRWVIHHPDWFLSLSQPPYPAYSFTGPDLSSDERVGIVLEDHYWNDSDAAVVFKRFDRHTGDERYIYHGNDGTSFPWNDTAQLDFLKPEVREAVIQTIIAVARRFPVIRFDAAMVLAKKHIERLWWPEPGAGSGIPSRAEHAIPRREFDRRIPVEFWREVVDRVAAEVPDTLLLAEAFWLLEGYFVRTLGMHRVYNSAFMHMLRDEDNAGYRRLIKETLEFDPGILKRYVNFMNNPDEQTALEQFGKGDKYFGIATLLATMPGLPMLGHGQVEGFSEKYGMEFRRARLDEQADPWLVERHEREIFPLFHRRGQFAEADDFLLFDFWTEGGTVDENVFAYSNGSGPSRSLVIYHNRFATTSGTIKESAAFAVKSDGGKHLVRRTLADGLGLRRDDHTMLAFRDARGGLEYLRPARDLVDHGLHLTLHAYEGHVFWEFREIADHTGVWRRLSDHLGGRGVPSLEQALREQELQPLHDALRILIRDGVGPAIGAPAMDAAAAMARLGSLYAGFLEALRHETRASGDAREVAADAVATIERVFAEGGAAQDLGEAGRAALLGRLLLSPIGKLAGEADSELTSLVWFDELAFRGAVAEGFQQIGLGEAEAWSSADLIRTLIALPRPGRLDGSEATLPGRLLAALLERDDLRPQMGLNVWEGVEYIGAEPFSALLDWAGRLDTVEGDGKPAGKRALERLGTAAESAGYRVEDIRRAVAPEPVGRSRRTSAASPRDRRPPPSPG